MAAVAKEAREASVPQSPRVALVLSVIIIILVAIASAGGIFLPSLYRGNVWMVNANRGQDVYTLFVALPAMALSVFAARRGAVRGLLVLAGIIGYMLYTYTGAALAYSLNEFFLIYVALFSLSLVGLIATLGAIDVESLKQRFDRATPRRAVASYLAVLGLLLAMVEVGQLIPFFISGTLPQAMQLAEATSFFPYALDLGLVLPLCLLSAYWLWRGVAWGYVTTAVMLIKAATMGLALLATNGYAWAVGGVTDPMGILFGYGFIGLGGLGFAVSFLRHCRA